MLSILKTYFFNAGVTAESSIEENGHIQTINEQSFYSFLFALLVSLIFYILGDIRKLATFTLIVSSGYLIPIFLNRINKYALAIFILNIWTHIIVLIASCAFGLGSGLHFIILLAAMSIKMDYQDRKTFMLIINYVVSYSIICVIILNDLFSWITPFNPLPISIEKYVNYVVFVIIVVIAQKTLSVYYINTSKVQQAIKDKKQAAEEFNQQKSNYLAAVSHDIRSPITVLVCLIDLLLPMVTEKKKLQEYEEIVKRNIEEFYTLLNDVMDISKIEANELKIELKKMQVDKLLEQLILEFEVVQKKYNKGNLRLDCKILEEDVCINTDRVRLQQIFRNLLFNAFKYTEEGIIEFGIEKKDDQDIVFFVSDTGKGIPSNQIKNIFSLYQQISKDDYAKGKGIGLFIVARLIQLLDGKIWVQSKEGKGSKFSFSIPINNKV